MRVAPRRYLRQLPAAFLIALSMQAGAADGPAPSNQPPGASGVAGRIEAVRVSEGVYRIGAVTLYKEEQRFSVPGRIVRLEPPLEFIAVSLGGVKAYESLIELEADAHVFNLACILLGLEKVPGGAPEFHFDERPVLGPPVSLTISWREEGGRREASVGDLLWDHGRPTAPATWVYTGSGFDATGAYLAAQDGTLVGFAHDPASVIEHKAGIGLGDYGAVGANLDLAPPVGTQIVLTVSVPRK
jgi:hypothetical protein